MSYPDTIYDLMDECDEEYDVHCEPPCRAVRQLAYRWERTRRGMGGPSWNEFLRRLPKRVKSSTYA